MPVAMLSVLRVVILFVLKVQVYILYYTYFFSNLTYTLSCTIECEKGQSLEGSTLK